MHIANLQLVASISLVANVILTALVIYVCWQLEKRDQQVHRLRMQDPWYAAIWEDPCNTKFRKGLYPEVK